MDPLQRMLEQKRGNPMRQITAAEREYMNRVVRNEKPKKKVSFKIEPIDERATEPFPDPIAASAPCRTSSHQSERAQYRSGGFASSSTIRTGDRYRATYLYSLREAFHSAWKRSTKPNTVYPTPETNNYVRTSVINR